MAKPILKDSHEKVKRGGGNKLELKGMKFGRLTVAEDHGRSRCRSVTWRCTCDCGNIVIVRSADLRSGNTKSCGCLRIRYGDIQVGHKYHSLTALRYCGRDSLGKSMWECRCDCGEIKAVRSDSLMSGHTKSCGCLHKERVTTHGFSSHTLYDTWNSMKGRCLNETNAAFKNYGGRGIEICDEWKHSIESFYKWGIENGWEKGLTIERIDNDNGYNPSNCKFATRVEQAGNRRQGKLNEVAVKVIKYFLEKGVSAAKLAKLHKVSRSAIQHINHARSWAWVEI